MCPNRTCFRYERYVFSSKTSNHLMMIGTKREMVSEGLRAKWHRSGQKIWYIMVALRIRYIVLVFLSTNKAVAAFDVTLAWNTFVYYFKKNIFLNLLLFFYLISFLRLIERLWSSVIDVIYIPLIFNFSFIGP